MTINGLSELNLGAGLACDDTDFIGIDETLVQTSNRYALSNTHNELPSLCASALPSKTSITYNQFDNLHQWVGMSLTTTPKGRALNQRSSVPHRNMRISRGKGSPYSPVTRALSKHR